MKTHFSIAWRIYPTIALAAGMTGPSAFGAQAMLDLAKKRSLGRPIQDLLHACAELAGNLQAALRSISTARLPIST
jgi:hypothetical protein